ncbi:MAG: hypothetical protein HY924_15480 [Elusimicrobia bacterium]|nr:hypothetical protein [Elusimicrobiota bacterium]
MRANLGVTAFLAALLLPAQALAGGLSLGIEANTVFNQDMKLNASPVLTRIETDNVTRVTTFRSMDYFSMTEYFPSTTTVTYDYRNRNIFDTFPSGTTVTYNRGWDNIDVTGNYIFLKLGYATEYFEGSAKIGAASKVINWKEAEAFTSTNTYNPTYPGRTSSAIFDGIQVTFDKGFAYGFELKGQPYENENFGVVATLRFDHSFNTVDTFKAVGIQYSTAPTGEILGQYTGEGTVDISHLRYGLALTATLKLEYFVPYLGFEYMDSRLRVTHRKVFTSTQYAFPSGAVTSATSTIDELTYTLKPKVPIGAVLGITFPFERGGITLEGTMRSSNSLRVFGYIGF